MTKVKAGGLSIILKTGMEVAQYYTVFKYRPPSSQKYLKYQCRIIVSHIGMKPEPIFLYPRAHKEKFGKETPSYALIMDNLETLLATTVYKACGNVSGAIVERFIKPTASIRFVHPVYSLDGPGPLMLVSGPHE